MRARIRDARHLSPDAQEVLREQAVAAVKQPGRSTAEVCRLLGISRQALSTWLTRQARGGRHPLQARPRGRPRGGQLTGGPAAQIVRTLTPCGPEQMHLPCSLWTRDAVGERIARRYGLRLSVWTVGRYLRAWGFTPQKPLRRAYERDPKAVRHWLEVEYPRIRAAATRAGAQIYWGEEMGLRSAHQAGTSWGKRSQTPVIRGPGRRFRCNMISVITNRGRLVLHGVSAAVHGAGLPPVLPPLAPASGTSRLVDRRWPSRAYCGGHPAVAPTPPRAAAAVLPASRQPSTQPRRISEPRRQDQRAGSSAPQDADDLAANVRGYLRSTQRMPAVVQSFFHHPAVRYAAE